jgi:hypothetical protein
MSWDSDQLIVLGERGSRLQGEGAGEPFLYDGAHVSFCEK